MTLKQYQTTLQLGTLYEVSKKGGVSGSEQLSTNLWINAGTVDVYSHNGATQPASLSQMTLNDSDTAVGGSASLTTIPRFIAIVQNTGTTTEMVTSGVHVNADHGAIS